MKHRKSKARYQQNIASINHLAATQQAPRVLKLHPEALYCFLVSCKDTSGTK